LVSRLLHCPHDVMPSQMAAHEELVHATQECTGLRMWG
jgi:hypothetical protein